MAARAGGIFPSVLHPDLPPLVLRKALCFGKSLCRFLAPVRFLARFMLRKAFCIARFLARFMHSGLSLRGCLTHTVIACGRLVLTYPHTYPHTYPQ